MINFIDVIQNNLLLILLVILTIEAIFIIFASLQRKKLSNSSDLDELYQKIKENIKYAVTPKFIDVSTNANDLVDLAVEIWRIEQRFNKSFSKLSNNQRAGFENSINKLKKFINKHDIEVIDYTNQKYNEGLNLDILSIEKKSSQSEPTIKETIEPTILCKGQVVRKAKIVLLSK